MLLVTHDLAEAAYLAPEDAMLLREGSIAQRGPMRDLVRSPGDDFAREFVAAQLARSRDLVALGGPA